MGKKTRKTGRGRPSSIDQLPEDLRLQLNADLRDRRKTQAEIVEGINEALKGRGVKRLSKSAVNRYSLAIEEKGAMMREAREAANALVGGLEEQKGTDLGRALTEMVKTFAFDIVANGGEQNLDTLKDLALITQRVEKASKISLEREAVIRKEAIENAAETVEETAKQMGMDSDQASFWRERVLKGM